MATIKEFVYAASPWGKTASGWMVFATSPGFDTGLVEKCAHWFRYVIPEGMPSDPPTDDLSKYPVQYVVARPFGDKTLLVSQTTFTGRRWYDPRPGDWFAHGLVVPETDGVGTSPFAWYRSPAFLTRYQDEWKEKARAIREKKIPWENPPALPEPETMEEVDPNWEYAWNEVLDRVPDGAWRKVGGLLSACANRMAGARALVFDALKSESLDTMDMLLELLPAKIRAEAQFATYFHADNVRETKADETFLFYGTVRPNEKADAETGVYGPLPTVGVAFAGRRDAELFKRMIDVCGEKLGTKDWDGLVACWEVASGRVDNPGHLRAAVKFAERFPGLEGEVEEGVSGTFADDGVGPDGGRAVALAAWFELEMSAFGDVAKEICGECAGDGALFGDALRTLDGDGPKLAFLDEVYQTASEVKELPRLATMWMGCGTETKRLVPEGGKERPFGRFAALVDRLEEIRSKARQKIIPDKNAASLLKEVEQAAIKLGSDFEGMEETKKEVGYQIALEKVKGLKDLRTFAKEASSLGIEKERIRQDGLKKVPLGRIPSDQLEESVAAFGAIGVTPREIIASVPDDRLLGVLDVLVSIGADRDEIIHRALVAAEMAAEERGRREGVQAERRQTERKVLELGRARFRAVLKTGLIGAGVAVLCFFSGYLLGGCTREAPEVSAIAPGKTTSDDVPSKKDAEASPQVPDTGIGTGVGVVDTARDRTADGAQASVPPSASESDKSVGGSDVVGNISSKEEEGAPVAEGKSENGGVKSQGASNASRRGGAIGTSNGKERMMHAAEGKSKGE